MLQLARSGAAAWSLTLMLLERMQLCPRPVETTNSADASVGQFVIALDAHSAGSGGLGRAYGKWHCGQRPHAPLQEVPQLLHRWVGGCMVGPCACQLGLGDLPTKTSRTGAPPCDFAKDAETSLLHGKGGVARQGGWSTLGACVTGRQAVAWLVRTAAVAQDEAQAVDIGNALMHRGLLHHVVSPTQIHPRPPVFSIVPSLNRQSFGMHTYT
jgi:Domain found in Dishevelled, Egl-10, and Pleckstrin (DEP)